jgi:hypothetical protein
MTPGERRTRQAPDGSVQDPPDSVFQMYMKSKFNSSPTRRFSRRRLDRHLPFNSRTRPPEILPEDADAGRLEQPRAQPYLELQRAECRIAAVI